MKLVSSTKRRCLHVDDHVDSVGDLHMCIAGFNSSVNTWLTPDQQDALIAHLIEVRGAGRVQALLRNPFDGSITNKITER